MYGDRFGSPGRDDRQDGSERHHAEWDARVPHDQPPYDDVKVAGAPIERPAVPDFSAAAPAMPEAAQARTGEHDLGDTRHDLEAVPDAPEPGDADTRHDFGVVPDGPEPATVAAGDEFAAMRRRPRTSPNLTKIGIAAAAAVVVLGGGTAGAMALTGGSGPAKKPGPSGPPQADAAAPAPLTEAQRKQIENERRTELKKKALRAARDERVRPMLFAKGEPPPTPKPTQVAGAGDPVPAGEAQRIARALMPSWGWSPSSQFGCLVNLWNRESHWNVHAGNPSGAYGIPQALPGSKMASAGPDWRNNATTQIKWGFGYIKDRYSTPCGAWSHSESTGWY